MKKHLLLLFIFGIFTTTFAQKSMMERKILPGKIDTLLLDYFNYSKLYSLDDIGFSDAMARQFMSLFYQDAKITDEVNPAYYDKDFDYPFNLTLRSLDDFIAKTKENYPNGLSVKYNALQIDYASLTVTILKETKGTTKTGLLYTINDTLKMKLNISDDLKYLKIQDITVLGYAITFGNDDDRDFIPNSLDKCPKEQGFRTATGCFTKEEKAAIAQAKKNGKGTPPVAVDNGKTEPVKKEKPVYSGPVFPGFFIGLSMIAGTNSFTTNFDESNLGYDKQIKGNSSVYNNTGLKQKKKAPFTQLQLDVDYYFGNKKIFGIATGIGLSSFNTSFTMDNFHTEYQSIDSKGRTYRRLSSVHGVTEELKIKSLNIPLLIQYKFIVSVKTTMSLGVGMNYHNVSSAKVSAKATADYEAIYKFDVTNRQNPVAIYDNSTDPSRDSWLITRNNVEAHNGSAQEQEYFAKKSADGYDVALDQALQKEENLKLVNAFGIISRLNFNFKLSQKLLFSTVLQYQTLSFDNSSTVKNYKLTDEIGSYNVLLKNVNTFKIGSVALGLGLKFTIK